MPSILFLDAAAGVGDGHVEGDLVLRRLMEADREGHGAFFRIFHRVGQDIGDDLLDPDLVAKQSVRRVRIDLDVEGKTVLLRPKAHEIDEVVHEGGQSVFRREDVHLARLYLGEIEDVVDDGKQFAGFPGGLHRVLQLLFPLQVAAHLRVDVRESHADGVDGDA